MAGLVTHALIIELILILRLIFKVLKLEQQLVTKLDSEYGPMQILQLLLQVHLAKHKI